MRNKKKVRDLPCWITTPSPIEQLGNGKVRLLDNQLLYSEGVLYLIPRNTCSDGYSIPLNIKHTYYDIRPALLHDIGCYYHKVIIVDIPLYKLDKYLEYNIGVVTCKDIPKEYLKVIDIGFNNCNNLLYEGMVGVSNIPLLKDKLYRFAVNFNINWLRTGRLGINLDDVYKSDLYTYKEGR